MDYKKKHKKVIKDNYETLIKFGVPFFILKDLKKWLFFIQEGWDGEANWHYSKEMSDIQQIKFYRFINLHNLESCLSKEIESKYNLNNKQQLEIKTIKNKPNKIYFDFFIDQKQLSKQVGINRFDMAYCDFDLDIIKTEFPNYDRKKIIKNSISRFLGNSKPFNQFKTNRIVLYRCHCGCDYCGIISFTLHIEDDLIIWKNLNYEDDDGFKLGKELNSRGINSIEELKFDKREYRLEFEKHFEKYCV